MLERTLLAPALALTLALAATPSAAAPDDEFGASWPEGPGREEIGYFCGACHSLEIVKAQGLTRSGWDGLLTWMTEYQNMPPLEGEERDLYLDYLAANFGVGRQAEAPAADAGPVFALPEGRQGLMLAPLEIRPAK